MYCIVCHVETCNQQTILQTCQIGQQHIEVRQIQQHKCRIRKQHARYDTSQITRPHIRQQWKLASTIRNVYANVQRSTQQFRAMSLHTCCGEKSINRTLSVRVSRNYISNIEEGWIMLYSEIGTELFVDNSTVFKIGYSTVSEFFHNSI